MSLYSSGVLSLVISIPKASEKAKGTPSPFTRASLAACSPQEYPFAISPSRNGLCHTRTKYFRLQEEEAATPDYWQPQILPNNKVRDWFFYPLFFSLVQRCLMKGTKH